LKPSAKSRVLLLCRFDRDGGTRVPFLSAVSMLDARDNEARSYLEFVDVLRQHGAAPKQDMHALWRRIVFSILISNTDDHLRNHGFLWAGPTGWRLSPAYDLNPVPVDVKPRVLTTAIDLEDNTASLKLAYEVAGYFELKKDEARAIAQRSERPLGFGGRKRRSWELPDRKSTAWPRHSSMRTSRRLSQANDAAITATRFAQGITGRPRPRWAN
jgi:serine/threonine protein kinase HipA of HipAB toxin-antitoxin module